MSDPPAAETQRLLAVARGDEPADLLIAGGRIANVFSGEIEPGDIAIAGSRIAGIGEGYRARRTLQLGGSYVGPAFIDAHVHIESSMILPSEFARVLVPRGVTAVVADPHEIANVAGLDGIRLLLDDALASPLTVYIAAPSCVPATALSTSGAEITLDDLRQLRQRREVAALGEMMDYPAVISGSAHVLEKLRAYRELPRDGHCPGLTGPALNAYVAAGLGSDHESISLEEAREKLSRGLAVFIREGSAARNLRDLLPLVDTWTAPRLSFCTDDRDLLDLLDEGSIDHMVRSAISGGVDPLTAIRMATLNTAQHFRLAERGAVAPGRIADLVVFEELTRPSAHLVFAGGELVARDGVMLPDAPRRAVCAEDSIHIDWSRVELAIPAKGVRIRAIGVVPDQLRTESVVMDCRVEGELAVADPERDLLKMAVIERHRGTGNVGLGFVRGMGLRSGAIAGTIAHDHHNLVAIGADDTSLLTAARTVAELGGGLAVCDSDKVLATLRLPVAGLMSASSAPSVAERLRQVKAAARSLGTVLRDPLMTMSFLALEVIPRLKLTDRGLVDVERMRIVPLFVE